MDPQDAETSSNDSPVPSPGGDENVPPSGEKRKEYKDGESITVFHDPDNFNVKHPLMHEWTLWFTKPPSGKVCGLYNQQSQARTNSLQGDNWNELLKEVVTFDSVEEFWGVHVCPPPPPYCFYPTYANIPRRTISPQPPN